VVALLKKVIMKTVLDVTEGDDRMDRGKSGNEIREGWKEGTRKTFV
jgi:hypothetical protein